MTAKNSLSISPEGNLAGQGTWQRRANRELLLSVENLKYGFDGLGSSKRAKRVKKCCNKLVNLIDVGDRRLVLANLFHSGHEVFTRLPD